MITACVIMIAFHVCTFVHCTSSDTQSDKSDHDLQTMDPGYPVGQVTTNDQSSDTDGVRDCNPNDECWITRPVHPFVSLKSTRSEDRSQEHEV